MKRLLRTIPHEAKEVLVNPRIVGEFGMERGSDCPALPYQYWVSTVPGEDLHFGPDFFDSGSTDKDHF